MISQEVNSKVGGENMSDVQIPRQAETHRTTFVETMEFKFLVMILFVCSAIALAFGRLLGRKAEQPFWKEARSAAHAIAGYAFKY
ncbi:MAG: hypothetical protein AAGA53_03605 [Pseudomonadota bacterium]